MRAARSAGSSDSALWLPERFAAVAGARAAPLISFQPYQSYYVGSWPQSVAVGDVTGDSRGDVLLATEEYNDPPNDFKLFLLSPAR